VLAGAWIEQLAAELNERLRLRAPDTGAAARGCAAAASCSNSEHPAHRAARQAL
jgi:hypothetical protein